MRILTDKIIQPYLTEKSSRAQEKHNEYAVIVDKSLSKDEIKVAVKQIFGIAPLEVRTVTFRKKTKKSRSGEIAPKSFKKALIRLPEGKRLELK